MRRYRKQWYVILISTVAIILIARVITTQDRSVTESSSAHDLLAYVVYDQPGVSSLLLYDPQTSQRNFLYGSSERIAIAFNLDGRIAFSAWRFAEELGDIFILDTQLPDQPPTNLSQEFDIPVSYVVSWSPDGRYLAFVARNDEGIPALFVWDGDKVTDITPDEMPAAPDRFPEAAWSLDGRLAFTVSVGSTGSSYPWEIYLWDGSRTTNLSQNPTGDDGDPSWNRDGEVAFRSYRSDADVFEIRVWDGVSVATDGSPDVESLINIAPDMIQWFSSPAWTSDERLAFSSQAAQDTRIQIYVWDGETATNISQNPDFHNGLPSWSNNGYWAFATFFSSEQNLYIRDAENHPLLTTYGQYPPAWSADNTLIFCQHYKQDWALSLWDGQRIIEITRGLEVSAQWQSGQGVVCSSG